MDFQRYNQAEQAQIAQMIEHKQVCTSTFPLSPSILTMYALY